MNKKKKMVEQIEELKADKEELKLKLQVQTDPGELDQLKTQNRELSRSSTKKWKASSQNARGYKRSLKRAANTEVVSTYELR